MSSPVWINYLGAAQAFLISMQPHWPTMTEKKLKDIEELNERGGFSHAACGWVKWLLRHGSFNFYTFLWGNNLAVKTNNWFYSKTHLKELHLDVSWLNFWEKVRLQVILNTPALTCGQTWGLYINKYTGDPRWELKVLFVTSGFWDALFFPYIWLGICSSIM